MQDLQRRCGGLGTLPRTCVHTVMNRGGKGCLAGSEDEGHDGTSSKHLDDWSDQLAGVGRPAGRQGECPDGMNAKAVGPSDEAAEGAALFVASCCCAALAVSGRMAVTFPMGRSAGALEGKAAAAPRDAAAATDRQEACDEWERSVDAEVVELQDAYKDKG